MSAQACMCVLRVCHVPSAVSVRALTRTSRAVCRAAGERADARIAARVSLPHKRLLCLASVPTLLASAWLFA
eukprot:360124-Chlamydomonas_euryale.AAC.2